MLAFRVDQLEREVAHDPHQRWEVLSVLLRIGFLAPTACLDLDVLGQVDNQAEVVELGLINRLLAVINEVGREQDGERENAHIMVLLLIGGA